MGKRDHYTMAKTRDGGLKFFYRGKIEEAELTINERTQNLRRLEAQRNALNAKGKCEAIKGVCSYQFDSSERNFSSCKSQVLMLAKLSKL